MSSNTCEGCQAYEVLKSHCHRYPSIIEKKPDDWCIEFKAKEVVIPCPVVEEKAKAEEKAVVEEKASEPVVTHAEPEKEPVKPKHHIFKGKHKK